MDTEITLSAKEETSIVHNCMLTVSCVCQDFIVELLYEKVSSDLGFGFGFV